MIANPTPRYYKIYRLLRQAIENREYPHDKAIPGEHALAKQYGVSRLTIRRSLDLLQQEGLVERRQGAGTYPLTAGIRIQPLPADINRLISDMQKMGADTDVRLLGFDYEVPSQHVQTQLELPVNEQVQKAVRVRYYEKAPFSYLITYVPEHIGRHFKQADLQTTSLQDILKKQGIRLGSAEQAFTATAADAHQAQALNVEISTPLLCIKRVTRDTNNRPIEYLIAVYNPRRFEYRMTLSNKRTRTGEAWVPDTGR